ncbi:MAG: hypothetical protein IKU86_00280 [Thermoguttaceae bacterium]|nr:hypothetical protein [Thermoguttaceae bacterium]
MKPITPAKRRLVVALAVAVKNYAKLQTEAEDLFESAEHASIGGALVPGSVYKEIDKLYAAASDAIWNAAITFARRKEREGAFQQLGSYDAWRELRFSLSKRRFRRAAIKIAKRGDIWNYDDDNSEKLEEWSK